MPRNSRDPFDQFMDEWEKFSASFKLILRLLRVSKQAPSLPEPAEIPNQEPVSMLRNILGWEGFSFATFTALGLALMQLPHQFDKARWCFVAAAMSLVIKLVNSVNVKLYPKLLIAVLGAISIGLTVNKVNDWVTALEVESSAKKLPEVRIVMPKATSQPSPAPPRSYIVFDGTMRFGERRDRLGQLVADCSLITTTRLQVQTPS